MSKRPGAILREAEACPDLSKPSAAPRRASGAGAGAAGSAGVEMAVATGAVRSQSHIERFRGRRLMPSQVGAPFGPMMLVQPLKVSPSAAAVMIVLINPRLPR